MGYAFASDASSGTTYGVAFTRGSRLRRLSFWPPSKARTSPNSAAPAASTSSTICSTSSRATSASLLPKRRLG